MKTRFVPFFFLVSSIALAFILPACAPQIELTSSWTNKKATIKSKPTIMVLVMAKTTESRQAVENNMVNEFKKKGHKAISSLDILKPNVQKYDSATMVNLLRQNNIDMLLTSAIVKITEKERYVPGTTTQVPEGTYATMSNPYYNDNYHYNNYYNSYSTNYYPQEPQSAPGYTVTDVEVIIESNLYSVAGPELLWFGQSKSYTQDPSTALFKSFAKIIVADIRKNNLIRN